MGAATFGEPKDNRARTVTRQEHTPNAARAEV